jgi:hypothetical protein
MKAGGRNFARTRAVRPGRSHRDTSTHIAVFTTVINTANT